MHDTLTVGIPVMVIVLGIFMNRSEVKDLRAEMKDLRAEMVRRFDLVDATRRDGAPLRPGGCGVAVLP